MKNLSLLFAYETLTTPYSTQFFRRFPWRDAFFHRVLRTWCWNAYTYIPSQAQSVTLTPTSGSRKQVSLLPSKKQYNVPRKVSAKEKMKGDDKGLCQSKFVFLQFHGGSRHGGRNFRVLGFSRNEKIYRTVPGPLEFWCYSQYTRSWTTEKRGHKAKLFQFVTPGKEGEIVMLAQALAYGESEQVATSILQFLEYLFEGNILRYSTHTHTTQGFLSRRLDAKVHAQLELITSSLDHALSCHKGPMARLRTDRHDGIRDQLFFCGSGLTASRPRGRSH